MTINSFFLSFLFAFAGSSAFGQLDSLEANLHIDSTVIVVENDTLTQYKLIATITGDHFDDLGFLAVNVYYNETISLVPEIFKTKQELVDAGLLEDSVIIMPIADYYPELNYTVVISPQNTIGAYGPAITIIYPH